jgi:hypothetical protein
MGGVIIAKRNFVSKSTLRSPGLWSHVVWYVDTNVSDEHTAATFSEEVGQVMKVGDCTGTEEEIGRR